MGWHDIGTASPTLAAEAAAASSILTKFLLYPIDTLKCRRQSGFVDIWKFKGMYSGLIPKLVLYAPYQALYMFAYTSAREQLFPTLGAFAFPVAGVLADLAGSPIRVPMEVVKQRMQAGVYKSSIKAVKSILASPRSQLIEPKIFIAQTLFHDLPYGLVQWTAYELLYRSDSLSSLPRNISPVVVGTFAGALAAFLTTPLDVVKTRIVTRPAEYTGIAQAILKISKEEGMRTFSRGCIFRVLHIAPGSGLYFGIFSLLYQLGVPKP